MGGAFKSMQKLLGVDSNDVAERFIHKWERDNELEMLEFWHRGFTVNRIEILREYVAFEMLD
jgi:hypothetical protein